MCVVAPLFSLLSPLSLVVLFLSSAALVRGEVDSHHHQQQQQQQHSLAYVVRNSWTPAAPPRSSRTLVPVDPSSRSDDEEGEERRMIRPPPKDEEWINNKPANEEKVEVINNTNHTSTSTTTSTTNTPNEQEQQRGEEGVGVDLKELEANCDQVPDIDFGNYFPLPPTISYSNNQLLPAAAAVVRLQPDRIPPYNTSTSTSSDIFLSLGFTKYVSVFGIPIIGQEDVDDSILSHAAKLLAKFVDNDENGIPDRPDTLQSILGYHTIIAYVKDGRASDDLWDRRFFIPENQQFRDLFICKIHFFEQWASDVSLEYHLIRNNGIDIFKNTLLFSSLQESNIPKALEESSEKKCTNEMRDVDLDWPLWYFPFTISYYGYLEDFDHVTIAEIKKETARAREAGIYIGEVHQQDEDMDIADFISWSILTVLGALDCHCDDITINEGWTICTKQELELFSPRWVNFITKSIGLPKILPNGEYHSDAILTTLL